MENELKEKVKIERSILNSWYIEVQRTKVVSFHGCTYFGLSSLVDQEEADRLRKRRDTTVDHEKQLRLAVQEIEQVIIDLVFTDPTIHFAVSWIASASIAQS